ncbi:MAG: 30S ribosomal protein S8 [Bacteroidetes bacterium]|nr:30S ribosomal protein S8 [Bacteroidota bacterium]
MDKIANMLIMIKNAGVAGKTTVAIPHSAMKEAIAKCLVKGKFIANVSKKTLEGAKAVLEIELLRDGKFPKITNVERISKPSKRVYVKAKDIKPVRQGFGMMVVSTPKGVMIADDAKKELVGGEALFRIW